MIERLIESSARNKLMVFMLMSIAAVWGIWYLASSIQHQASSIKNLNKNFNQSGDLSWYMIF